MPHPCRVFPLALVVSLSVLACKRDNSQYSEEPAPAVYGEHSPSPTPGDVCEHLAQMIAAEIGAVDPAVRAATVEECTVEMVQEEQLRGPDNWDLVARCVLASASEADIDRCDQLYPRPGGSQPAPGSREEEACIYMLGLLLYESGTIDAVTDAELTSMQQECLLAFEQDRAQLSSGDYERMVDCILAAPSVAAMEQC